MSDHLDKEESRPESPQSPSERTATAQALGNAVENMQSTFASIFSSFQQNIQSAQSAQSLNAFLQRVVDSSVKIETCLEPSDHAIRLTVTITNMFQMSLPDVHCSITFASEGVRWSSVSATQQPVSGETQGIQSLFEGSETVVLAPLCQYIETLHIKTESPVQCDARIRLDFPGPVPHIAVPVEHAFGIYIIDQLPKTISSEQCTGKPIQCREYPANAFRSLMQIPPRQGLESGLCIALQIDHLHKITCRVEGFKDDFIRIGFYANSEQGIEELVIQEMDKLLSK